MEEANLPVPEFTDTFQSFFDPKTDGILEKAVREFSPLEERCQKICKIYKHPSGKTIKTLDFKILYEQLIPRTYRQRRLLVPANNVPEEAWKPLRLLRVDFNMRKDQVTALAWSGHTGNFTNLTRLLRSGAYADRPLLNGNTVLMETINAFSANRLECVRALLSAGARVNIENKDGHTAMTVAASVGDLNIIKLLLSKRYQLDLEHKTKMGHTALTMAATAGHIDTVRYLVDNCDVNIIVEDDRCLTTLCWAHIKSPPVAAYLSVILTVQDHADTFLRRRLEVIGQYPDDLNILSTFYSICLVFLQIRSARDLLVRNGSITTIMKHPQWDSIDYCCGNNVNESDKILGNLTRDFSRIQPWIIALTCAMAYNDTYIVEKFLQSDYETVISYINNMAEYSGVDQAARRLTQSSLLPLFTNERARMRLLEMADSADWYIQMHLTDDNDLLSNEMFAIVEFFMENFDEVYGKYNLKVLKSNLDEATKNKVFPKPMNSLRKKLIDAIACFEDLKRMIHQKSPVKEPAEEEQETPMEKTVEEAAEKLSKRAKKMRRQTDVSRSITKPRSREISESRSDSTPALVASNNENNQIQNGVPTVNKKIPNQQKLSAVEEFHKLWVQDVTDKAPEAICAKETSRIRANSELDAFNVKGMSVSQSSSSTSILGLPEEAPVLYRKTSLEENSNVIVLSHRVDVKTKPQASLFRTVNAYTRPGLSNKQVKKMERQKKKDRQQARNFNRTENSKFLSMEYDASILNASSSSAAHNRTENVHGDAKSLRNKENKTENYSPPTTLKECVKDLRIPPKPSPQELKKVQSQPEGKGDAVHATKSYPTAATEENVTYNEPFETCSSVAINFSENNVRSWITDVSSEVDLYEGQNLSESGSQYETASSQQSWSENNSTTCSEKLPLKTKFSEDSELFIPSIHDISFGDFGYPQNIIINTLPPNALLASHLEEEFLNCAMALGQDESKSDNVSAQENNELLDIEFTQQEIHEIEEWERANPICHNLQKLHRAASSENTNLLNDEEDDGPLIFGDFEDLNLEPIESPLEAQAFNPSADAFIPVFTGFNIAATRAPPGFNRVITLMEVINWTPQSCRWKNLYQSMLSSPISRFTVNGPLYLEEKEEYCLSKGSKNKSAYLGINKDGSEIVVKCLDKDQGSLMIEAIKELRQGDLISANILKYKGFSENESNIYLEMGLCEYNLEEYLHHLATGNNVVELTTDLCRQLLNGLSALHAVGILHMNLKPSNVLIDNTGCIRLADFGIPSHFQLEKEDENLCWKPLETFQTEAIPYGTKSDVQVAGMLLHYIVTRNHPYGDSYKSCQQNIMANKPDLQSVTNQVFANLMTWMLHPKTALRKSINMCLIHPFFWSSEKMFTFLKLVSQEPDMDSLSGSGDEVCQALDKAQRWMKLDSNEMNTVVQKILSEGGFETKTIGVKHVLKAMVLAQEKLESWPNGFFPLFMKSPDALELSHNPMTFFLTHYSRVFIGVYDIISHSAWRNRAALSLFFDRGQTMDIY